MKTDFLTMIHGVSALSTAILDLAEVVRNSTTDTKEADKLLSLAYLMQELAETVESEADRRADCVDTRIDELERENAKLRETIVSLVVND